MEDNGRWWLKLGTAIQWESTRNGFISEKESLLRVECKKVLSAT